MAVRRKNKSYIRECLSLIRIRDIKKSLREDVQNYKPDGIIIDIDASYILPDSVSLPLRYKDFKGRSGDTPYSISPSSFSEFSFDDRAKLVLEYEVTHVIKNIISYHPRSIVETRENDNGYTVFIYYMENPSIEDVKKVANKINSECLNAINSAKISHEEEPHVLVATKVKVDIAYSDDLVEKLNMISRRKRISESKNINSRRLLSRRRSLRESSIPMTTATINLISLYPKDEDYELDEYGDAYFIGVDSKIENILYKGFKNGIHNRYENVNINDIYVDYSPEGDYQVEITFDCQFDSGEKNYLKRSLEDIADELIKYDIIPLVNRENKKANVDMCVLQPSYVDLEISIDDVSYIY